MSGFIKFSADGDGKKCPLFIAGMNVGDCIEEKCMFWLDDVRQCSIPVLARQALGKQALGKPHGATAVGMQTF